MIENGSTVIDAELPTGAIARHLRDEVLALHGVAMEIRPDKRTRAFVAVSPVDRGELARTTELLDRRGRPLVGLPQTAVGSAELVASAAWRRVSHLGKITFTDRASTVDILCPSLEAAIILVGCARRGGIDVREREVRGTFHVTGDDNVGELLSFMGAADTRLVWEMRRASRDLKLVSRRLFDPVDANSKRSVTAAERVSEKVERPCPSWATRCRSTSATQASCD